MFSLEILNFLFLFQIIFDRVRLLALRLNAVQCHTSGLKIADDLIALIVKHKTLCAVLIADAVDTGGILQLQTVGSNISVVQIGSLTNWTAVSGYSTSDIYAYGIAGDDLYILYETATQIGKATAIYGVSTDSYPTLAVYSA